MDIRTIDDIIKLIESDEKMMEILKMAENLNLPEWWIGAGFIRNKVRDHISGFKNKSIIKGTDIDLVYFDSNDTSEETEKKLEKELRKIKPSENRSVKNQSRMHTVNGDNPYSSSLDAISHWPETATSIAIKIEDGKCIKFEALYGIEDLINMIARPTPPFKNKKEKYEERKTKKNWAAIWPNIKYED